MMFRYLVFMVVMLAIMMVEFKRYGRVISATVIYPVMWILSVGGLILEGDSVYTVTWFTLVIIILGYGLFALGFGLQYSRAKATAGTDVPSGATVTADDIQSQRIGLDIVVGIAVLIGLVYAFYLVKDLDFSDLFESWRKIRARESGSGSTIPYVFVIAGLFVRCALWYIAVQLFMIAKDKAPRTRDGFNARADLTVRFILVVLAFLPIMLADFSRNDVLFIMLPVLFAFILGRRLNNGKALSAMAVAFLIFGLFFVWFSKFRGGTLDDGEFLSDSMRDNVIHYLSHSVPALDMWVKEGKIELATLNGRMGLNTIAALTGIWDKLFGTELTSYVVQPRTNIGPTGKWDNVYTVYQWTALDFGLIYALLWQFLLGLLYGKLYAGAVSGKVNSVFWYSVLSYPLIMMFFEDQYFSIGQSWLILLVSIFGIYLVCNKTRMKIRR